MTALEQLLLECVAPGETPLYSAYRWTGEELGREVSLPGFLALVDRLVRRQALQLWSIDPSAHTRERLDRVPHGLEAAYEDLRDLDATFDPFGLSLTLVPGQQGGSPVEWYVDVDFERAVFSVYGKAESIGGALDQLGLLYPDVRFVVERQTAEPGGTRVDGVFLPNR